MSTITAPPPTARSIDPAAVKANIYGILISIGIVLSCFASFAILRSAAFEPSAVATQTEMPQGLEDALTPKHEQVESTEPIQCYDSGTPIYDPAQCQVRPAANVNEDTSDLDALWTARNNGALPATPGAPSCTNCSMEG